MKIQSLKWKFKYYSSEIGNHLFLFYNLFRSRIISKRKIRILFSIKEDWHSDIKRGFQFTQHVIEFGRISEDNIKDYDVIVPLTINDLKYLNDKRELIINNPLPIPSIESVLLCDDKYLLNQALTKNGFGSLIPKMGGTLTYPYILKKRTDEWAQNCYIIKNSQQEKTFSDIIVNPEYFTQEFITGSYEYALHAIFKNGKILCSMNIEYTFETESPIKGQEKRVYKKICHCPYLDIFSSILASIGFEGLCCFNYKVHDNKPFIIEINPRFGGSLCPFFSLFINVISIHDKNYPASQAV